jgi:hypothetical protein
MLIPKSGSSYSSLAFLLQGRDSLLITISFMIPELAGHPFIKVPNPIASYIAKMLPGALQTFLKICA